MGILLKTARINDSLCLIWFSGKLEPEKIVLLGEKKCQLRPQAMR